MLRSLPRFSASSSHAAAGLAVAFAAALAAPVARAQTYAPTAPPALAVAAQPDRVGLALRVSTYSVIPALMTGPHVDGLSGVGAVLRVRFVPWLSGELSFDTFSGSNLGLSRTSRPLVASIVAELRPFSVFSPFLTAGAGVMWSSYRGGAFGEGAQREGLALIGAGLRVRLYRGLVASAEARALFSGTEGNGCDTPTQCSPRASADAYGLQLSFTLGYHF